MSIQVSDLPLKLLLKNRFHLGAGDVAFFGLAVGLAWYAKPLFGWLSDVIPFRGTRRRHYLLLSSLIAAATWGALAVLPPTYQTLFIGFLILNAMKTMSSTVLGGVLVDTGQRFGITGRLSSQRTAVSSAVVLIAGPIAGFLASRAFHWAAVASGICALLLGYLCFAWYTEVPREANAAQRRSEPTTVTRVRELLRSRSLWWGLAMSFLFTISPGFGTPLLYVQQDTLHFSSQFIGNLAMIDGAGGLLGAVIYSRLCRTLPLRYTILGGSLLSVAATLFYLRYQSAPLAIIITGLSGIAGALAGLPVADLTARATPKGSEALGYSLMISASNIAFKFSDVLGSWLYQHKHFHFPTLVWLNAGTTLAMLVILPLIPRSLADQHD